MTARTVTPADAMKGATMPPREAASLGALHARRCCDVLTHEALWSVRRADGTLIAQVSGASGDRARVIAELLAAAPDLAATVEHLRAQLRPWQDAAADATTLRVRAESDRDAALAHAAELESALRAAREDADRETRWLGVVRETAEREALDTIALRAAACTLLDALAEERRAWSAPLSGLPLPRYGGGPAETAAREVAEAAMRALAGVPDAR